MILTYLLHPAVSISDFARALILDFSFVGKIRVIPSIMGSILCRPIHDLCSLNQIEEQRNFFGPSNILDPGVSTSRRLDK